MSELASSASARRPVGPVRRRAGEFFAGRGALVVPVILAVLLVFFPQLSGQNEYWIRQLSLIAVFAMVVSGVNLSFGFAGEVQFGQVFMFAFGAYLSGILAIHFSADIVLLLLAAGIGAALLGAVIAIPALRIGGWSLAMVSFFLVIAIPDFVNLLSKYTGGSTGLSGIPVPTFLGSTLGRDGLYTVTVATMIVWFAVYRNFALSRYGLILRTLRESPILASSLGFSGLRLKVLAYALGAFPAGMAGCLYGFISVYFVPSTFSLGTSIGVVAASILGGAESIYGAILGAALLQLGPLNSLGFAEYAPVAYGVFLIVAAIVFRRGLGGLGTWAAGRVSAFLLGTGGPSIRASLDTPTAAAGAGATETEAAGIEGTGPGTSKNERKVRHRDGVELAVRGVGKSFGGVQALNDVSLVARPGEVTALIGSNGSGKTTLLNIICGYHQPDTGSIAYGARRLDGTAPFKVAQLGVRRTFQTPRVPSGATALEAVASGRFVEEGCGVAASVTRAPRYWRTRRNDVAAAEEALDLVGLGHLAEAEASSLALGTRRLVEVARALCGRSDLLLLDEPASGLSEEEVERLGVVVRAAAEAGSTVVLIEHNFAFIRRVSDTAHVLHLGEVIASGPAATIGDDPRVIESYLGATSSRRTTPRHPLGSGGGVA